MNYLNVFKELKATKSRNKKIEILQQADQDTQDILIAAYDPFTHYFINKVPKYTPYTGGISSRVTHPGIKDLLFSLSQRKITGNNAKGIAQDFLNTLYEEDAEIFKNILRKDLRCGIGVATINAAIPGLISDFGCMLAKKYTDDRYEEGLLMSLKLDGLRARFMGGEFYTRNGHKILGMEHLTKVIPAIWEFDAELKDPNIHFQETSGDIRSFAAAPETEMFVIDAPFSDMPFYNRYELYKHAVKNLDHNKIHAVKHVPVKSREHIQSTFEKSLVAGYEGLVVKPKNHLYVPKRSWGWMKLKAERSEDLPIVGFFEGQGKYEGQLGGIIVERENGVNVRVGSGFSDAERESIWHAQSTYTNTIVEIAYHEETPDKSLRHPIFKRFRGDKE